MESQEFKARLRALRQELRESLPREALTMAQDGLTATRKRIQRSGTDSEGQKFPDYNPIYAKYGRLAQGYQVQNVDFTRKGRMWASITPEIIEAEPGRVVVEIKARTDEEQTKLNGQFKKRGNILEWSEKVRDAVQAANNARISRIVQKYLGDG